MLRNLLLLGMFLSIAQVTQAQKTEKTLPYGKLVDIGGYKLHMSATGSARETIIIEGGTGQWSIHWKEFQEKLAKKYRVITYDRAGYGWSDPSPYVRSVDQISEELNEMLMAAKIEGPYILLGHSFGGYVIKSFYKKYPEKVSQLIFAEAANERQFEFLPPIFSEMVEWGKADFKKAGFALRMGMMSKKDIPIDSTLNKSLWNSYQERSAQASYYDAMFNEMSVLPISTVQCVIDSKIDLPVTVITAENSTATFAWAPGLQIDESNEKWMILQKEFLKLSTQSKQHVVKGANHDLLKSAPDEFYDLVISSITK